LKVTKGVILLAGGLGSRIGSDKALYQVAGKPMISHIVDRLANLSDEFLIVIARNAPKDEYSRTLPEFTRLVNDELEGKSPLIGILTGLRAMKSQYAIVLSCDAPFVNKQVIQLLLEHASNADAAVPRWSKGRLEPLQAVYRKSSMLSAAEQALAQGQLSPIAAVHRLEQVVYVSVEGEIGRIDPDLRTFFNVNTREDVSRAEIMLRR
jgi:molybdopterin-guanine dinucleotide biosynthesis protein A